MSWHRTTRPNDVLKWKKKDFKIGLAANSNYARFQL
jgi:hypothetical protein